MFYTLAAVQFFSTNVKDWIGKKSNFGIIHRYFVRIKPVDNATLRQLDLL